MTDYSPLINRWYQSVQFRNGPTSEVQSFNAELNSGVLAEAQVQQSIINASHTGTFVNPIIREYQVAFNRVPDQGGERFWTGLYSTGAMNIGQVSYVFASAPEFYAIYGVTAESKITTPTLIKLYENMFCRAPDAAGLQYWLDRGLSTAETLTAFVTSPEAKGITVNSIPAYQQDEILGTEATTGSLFQYGGCVGAPITIQMQTSVQTIDVKEPTDKVNVETVQQPVGSTWMTGSIVNGGGNTDINLKMNGNPGGGVSGSTVTANKILNLNVNLTDSGNLDTAKFTNVSNIIINNGVENKALTIDEAQLSSNYNISLDKAVIMKFDSFANAAGTSDTLLLTGNNAGVSVAKRATFDVVGDNTIETVDLNQTGTNYLKVNTGSAVSKIILEGSGTSNIDIAAGASGSVAGHLATFDASRFNGDLIAKFDAGATSGLSSLPNIVGSAKSNTLFFEKAFDNNSEISITLQGTGIQRLGYSDGGILTKIYDVEGGNGQFFISSDGTATGTAFTNGSAVVRLGNGNNYVNLGDDMDFVTVGNGSNTIYTGAGSDHIELGNGVNTVCGGAGADIFITGGQHVTSLYTAIGQTGADTATGNSVATADFDHYRGVQSGYNLQFTFLSGVYAVANSTTSVAGMNNTIVYVRGNETSVGDVETFIADANGLDTLVVFDADPTSGTNFEAVVFNEQYAASSTVTPTPGGGTTTTVQGTVVESAITDTSTSTAYTITSNYIPAGIVSVNANGIVTSGSAADKINVVGTPSPSTVKVIDVSGLLGTTGAEITTDATNKNIGNIIGSSGGDVINLDELAGPITITAGGGVDGISINRIGTSVVTANYSAPGQTGTQNGVGNNVTAIAYDEYMGLANGDKFSFSFLSGFGGGTKISWSSVAGSDNAVTFVEGSFANGSFTAGAATSDKATLIVYDTDPTIGAANYEGILLLGDNFSGILNGSSVTLKSAEPPTPPVPANDVIVDVTSDHKTYTVTGKANVPLTLDANYLGQNLYPAQYVTFTPDSYNQPLQLETINMLQLASNPGSGQNNIIKIEFGGSLYQTELLPDLKSVAGTNAADLFQITGTERFTHGITLNGNAGDDVFNFGSAGCIKGDIIDGGTGINKIILNEASSVFSGGGYGFAGPGPKFEASISNIDTIELSSTAQTSASSISIYQNAGVKNITGFNYSGDGLFVRNNSGNWNTMASSKAGVTGINDWFFEYAGGKGTLYYIDPSSNQVTQTDVVGTTGGMTGFVYAAQPSFLEVLAQ